MDWIPDDVVGLPYAVWVTLYLVWLGGSILFLLAQRRAPTATLAWLMAFMLLPGLALPAWLLFGPQRMNRERIRRTVARSVSDRVAPLEFPLPEWDADAQTRMWLEHLGGLARIPVSGGDPPPRQATRVTILQDGPETFSAIEAAIAQARAQIHLEYYIFEPDALGTRWRDMLVARARQGVAVRVLLDAVGSFWAHRAFWRPLLAAGGEVRRFNRSGPLRLLSPGLINFRTHRKIVVVDGIRAFTGGINVMQKAYLEDGWRDTHLELHGAPALDFQRLFLEDWLYAGVHDRRCATRDRVLVANAMEMAVWFPPQPPARADAPWVQVIGSGPDQPQFNIHAFYFGVISTARKRVWLTTAYFIPDEPILMALTSARARGVDVRLLVPARGNKRVAQAASSTFLEEAHAAGVQIWRYRPSMIHAKTLVVDDHLAIVGTANLDNRSFRLNFEVTAAIYGTESNRVLANAFERDISRSARLRVWTHGRHSSMLARLVASASRLVAPLL